MNEQEKVWLEYLLADFRAIKDEIARRSNLQKASLAVLVGFNALLLNAFVAKEVVGLHIVALWVVTALVFIFDKREGLEIKRLGDIIRNKIAEPVSKLLNIESRKLLPSETDNSEPRIDYMTRIYDNIFRMLVFIAVPGATTIYFAILYCANKPN
jgi:hypothetical protein